MRGISDPATICGRFHSGQNAEELRPRYRQEVSRALTRSPLCEGSPGPSGSDLALLQSAIESAVDFDLERRTGHAAPTELNSSRNNDAGSTRLALSTQSRRDGLLHMGRAVSTSDAVFVCWELGDGLKLGARVRRAAVKRCCSGLAPSIVLP